MWLSAEVLFEDRDEELRIWNRADLESHTTRIREYVPKPRNPDPDAVNSLKTHCPFGHEYTPENTFHRRDTNARECRTCRRRRRRERRENGC